MQSSRKFRKRKRNNKQVQEEPELSELTVTEASTVKEPSTVAEPSKKLKTQMTGSDEKSSLSVALLSSNPLLNMINNGKWKKINNAIEAGKVTHAALTQPAYQNVFWLLAKYKRWDSIQALMSKGLVTKKLLRIAPAEEEEDAGKNALWFIAEDFQDNLFYRLLEANVVTSEALSARAKDTGASAFWLLASGAGTTSLACLNELLDRHLVTPEALAAPGSRVNAPHKNGNALYYLGFYQYQRESLLNKIVAQGLITRVALELREKHSGITTLWILLNRNKWLMTDSTLLLDSFIQRGLFTKELLDSAPPLDDQNGGENVLYQIVRFDSVYDVHMKQLMAQGLITPGMLARETSISADESQNACPGTNPLWWMVWDAQENEWELISLLIDKKLVTTSALLATALKNFGGANFANQSVLSIILASGRWGSVIKKLLFLINTQLLLEEAVPGRSLLHRLLRSPMPRQISFFEELLRSPLKPLEEVPWEFFQEKTKPFLSNIKKTNPYLYKQIEELIKLEQDRSSLNPPEAISEPLEPISELPVMRFTPEQGLTGLSSAVIELLSDTRPHNLDRLRRELNCSHQAGSSYSGKLLEKISWKELNLDQLLVSLAEHEDFETFESLIKRGVALPGPQEMFKLMRIMSINKNAALWDLAAIYKKYSKQQSPPINPLIPLKTNFRPGAQTIYWHYRALLELIQTMLVDLARSRLNLLPIERAEKIVRNALSVHHGIDYSDLIDNIIEAGRAVERRVDAGRKIEESRRGGVSSQAISVATAASGFFSSRGALASVGEAGQPAVAATAVLSGFLSSQSALASVGEASQTRLGLA